MAFKKGQSGNPKGRPKGTSQAAKLRHAIQDDLQDIINAMVEAAKMGDTSAAAILLDRAIPKLKPQTPPTQVPRLAKADSLTDKASAVLDAAASGELDPDTALALIGAVSKLARVVEIDDIEKRLTALEGKTPN